MICELIDEKYFPDDFKTRRKDTLTIAEDNCNKCRGLEQQLLSIEERVRAGSQKRHEDQDESSISSSSGDVKIKTKSNKEKKNNPEIEMLCAKINDYMIAKDQEKNLIDNMKDQLKHNEEEVNDLRNKLREKDEHFMRQQYQENIKSLNNVIGNQNEKIIHLNAELQKTKNMLQFTTLRENVEKSKEKEKTSNKLEDSGKTETVISDFLENMKSKLTNLENAELSIDDDFEELSVASSGNEAKNI